MEARAQKHRHFVLVHGACHGAWCWYKVSTLLSSAGHRVTALDLAGCGRAPRAPDDVPSYEEHVRPLTDLLESLPEGDGAVLVGHSMGGFAISYAMDRFPEKIEAAVFVAAFLPDTVSPPYHVYKRLKRSREGLLDTQYRFKDGKCISVLFGPKALATLLYNRCSPQDLTLATALVHEAPVFQEELSTIPPFSRERFGSVRKFYVVVKGDRILGEEFQRGMVENSPVDGVVEIDGADHMVMTSQPEELFRRLVEIGSGSG